MRRVNTLLPNPEPKILTPNELAVLALNCGGARQAAAYIGASEAFVRQNMQRLGGDGSP